MKEKTAGRFAKFFWILTFVAMAIISYHIVCRWNKIFAGLDYPLWLYFAAVTILTIAFFLAVLFTGIKKGLENQTAEKTWDRYQRERRS